MALTVFATTPLGANLERADTSATYTVGTRAIDNFGGEWVYVQANGAVAQYDAVKVDDDFQAAGITTTISGAEPTAVGIAQVALADNEYGFVFRGKGGGSGSGVKVNVLISCAADVKLHTTATAGKLDDTATDCVQGLKILTAEPGSGTAAIECYAAQLLVTNSQD